MTFRDHAGAALAGAVAGLAGGLFGVGGGILLVPMLTGFFRLSQHQAHGTSLAAIGATALAALIVYAAHGNVAWWTALPVAFASIWTARYGARWTTLLSKRALARAFAVFLVLVAARMLWRIPAGSGPPLATGWPGLALDLALGAAVGLLAGFMGVGGGLIAVPAFTLLLGMSQQAAQGTSLAVILVAAPAGAFEHARHGHLVGRLLPGLVLGAVVGAPLASWFAQSLPHELLARAFALFLLANAAYSWIRSERTVAA
jgi:uncharacterized membrane protein YfcA